MDGAALQDKWYGESQKLAGALFSLARKLQPTIIFIDEIDSLLRMRDSRDHEATAMIKAQFMQLWDGLSAGGADSVEGGWGILVQKFFSSTRYVNRQLGLGSDDISKYFFLSASDLNSVKFTLRYFKVDF